MSISEESKVLVHYFAVLRDQANTGREEIPLVDGDTPTLIYRRMAERYGFQLSVNDLRMAVNDEFAAADSKLKHGDHLAFIPPVAGG